MRRGCATCSGNDLDRVARRRSTRSTPTGAGVTPVVRVHAARQLRRGRHARGRPGLLPADRALPRRRAVRRRCGTSSRPPDAEPIELTGTELSLDVDDSTLDVGAASTATPTPVTLGRRPGRPRPARRCTRRWARFRADRPRTAAPRPVELRRTAATSPGSGSSTLPGASITGTRHPAQPHRAAVRRRGAARAGRAVDDVRRRRAGHASTPTDDPPTRSRSPFDGQGATPLTLQQRWMPDVVPALVAGPLPPDSDGNRFTLAGLDGEAQDAAGSAPSTGSRRRGPTPSSPTSTRSSAAAPSSSTDRLEVWFADDDPALLARVTDALDEHGHRRHRQPDADRRTSARTTSPRPPGASSWPRWSVPSPLLIALLVLVVSAVSGWRFRTRDLAALRMSGVPGPVDPVDGRGRPAPGRAGRGGRRQRCPGSSAPSSRCRSCRCSRRRPRSRRSTSSTAWLAVLVAAVLSLRRARPGSVLIGRALAARAELRRLRETL